MDNKEITAANKEAKFTKEELMASKTFADKQDLIGALLMDDRKYTIAQAEKLIDNYLSKEV